MKEIGHIEGYYFKNMDGPLSKRLQLSIMIRLIRYPDHLEHESMAYFTSAQKEQLLNVQELVLRGARFHEIIHPQFSLEELASDINRLTNDL
jgi:hypothetical protein